MNNALFDERKQMSQTPRVKWMGILLAVAAAGFSASAQKYEFLPLGTNAPSSPGTNAALAPAQPYASLQNEHTNAAPPGVRQMTLQDCIQLALQHNIELQIDRYNPQIQIFTLRADYGAYDPALSFSGQHQHNEAGSRLLSGGFTIPGSVSDSDSFNTGLGQGLLPWGMTYDLQANISDTKAQNFNIDTNGNTIPSSIENSGGSASLNVTQPLLKNFWIDQPRMTIRIAKNRLKYSNLQLKLQVMQTITTLEQAYYDLIYNRENVVVQQMAAEQTDRLVMESKKKLEVGALSPLDLASAEAQAAQNSAAIIAAKSELGTQERRVKQLITDQFAEWADVNLQPAGNLTAPKMLFNRQDSWSRALADRPELLQAKLDAERAGIQLKFDWNQIFPELDVFGTYGYNGSGRVFSGALYDIQQQNRPFYTFGGRITIPLANVAARNNYKSDKVALQQFVLTVKKTERDIMIAIDNDIGTLQADYDAVQATRTQREYEEQALDAEQKKLENGKSTTYQVLLVQRDLTAARGAEIRALDTYNKDIAQFSLDEGSTFDRLGINWETQ